MNFQTRSRADAVARLEWAAETAQKGQKGMKGMKGMESRRRIRGWDRRLESRGRPKGMAQWAGK